MDVQTNRALCKHRSWEDFNTWVNYENVSVIWLRTLSLKNIFVQNSGAFRDYLEKFLFFLPLVTFVWQVNLGFLAVSGAGLALE